MKRRMLAALLAALMLTGLTACGAVSEEEIEAPREEEVPEELPQEPEPVPEPCIPSGTNPLTGEPMEEAYEADRPVAVMFNNLKAAQPQVGISKADVIYEVPAEGGITRMLALYQSLEGVEILGSVRSTRPYYIELALAHDALLVHAGGSPEAYRDISSWNVDNMDGVNGGSDADIFWRDQDRRKTMGYEHSMVTSGEKILEYLAEGHFRRQHQEGFDQALTFAEDGTPAGGTTAEHISLKFSYYKTGTFDYDAASGAYFVGQYGAPYTDGADGTQVTAVNVLVLETSIYVNAGDSAGRMTAKLTGEGTGTFFCGGRSVPICWSRTDRYSPFLYTLEDGTPLTLGQGKSYICIINPRDSVLAIS